jgi:hypothetical protein
LWQREGEGTCIADTNAFVQEGMRRDIKLGEIQNALTSSSGRGNFNCVALQQLNKYNNTLYLLNTGCITSSSVGGSTTAATAVDALHTYELLREKNKKLIRDNTNIMHTQHA